MANITITVQSLFNAADYDSYTIDDGQTVNQLKTAINTATGTDSAWYDIVKNETVLSGTSTLSSLGITSGVQLRTHNKISALANRELRQKAKLNLAAAKRKESYDINKLPTQYSGNAIVDNSNTGGLEERRPWTIDYARVMEGMVLWLDAGDTDSYPGTGTTWTDLAGTANNFTLFNTPTWNSAGYFDFDNASNEYAAITHTSTLKPTAALTVEQWLNADDWTAGTPVSYFTSLSCTQGGGYAHYIWSSTFVSYVYAANLSNYLKPTANVSALTGWHHFTTTFDGRYARLYVDGVLTDTKDAGASTTISYDPDNDICIGAEAGTLSTPAAGLYWNGKIATTAIYNRALSASEIVKNFDGDKARFGL